MKSSKSNDKIPVTTNSFEAPLVRFDERPLKMFTNFSVFNKLLICKHLQNQHLTKVVPYQGGCMCAKPKKAEKQGIQTMPKKRTIIHLLDAMIDCNIDKSVKNFPIWLSLSLWKSKAVPAAKVEFSNC